MSSPILSQLSRELVMIDADGGADDILAIMFALMVPTWNIIAIMCSYGNVSLEKSCTNIFRLLTFLKRTEIPVYQGTDKSLVGTVNYDEKYHGFDGIGGASLEYPIGNKTCSPGIASIVMIDIARKYNQQVTLLALGPLTDLAVAARLDPNFPKNLKKLLIMGGNYKAFGNIGRAVEFNFFCDPEAAEVVIAEFSPHKIVSTWEACIENAASWDWYDGWTGTGTPAADFIHKVNSVAVKNMKEFKDSSFSCCDMLAVTGIAYPDTVKESQINNAVVEFDGKFARGMMLIETRTNRNFTPNVILHKTYDMGMVLEKWNIITE